jgi:acylphosphatase
MAQLRKAKIISHGFVQGVGYRYFVMRAAGKLGLNGFTQNLGNGDVLTVVEGEEDAIQEIIKALKEGPRYAVVQSCDVEWLEYDNEFSDFDIIH